MSASREKRERQLNKKPAPTRKSHRARNWLIICVAVLLLVYMAASSLGMFHRTLAAAYVGDVSFTAAEVNMYYNMTRAQVLNMYGITDEPGLDEEDFYTGLTFGDYFRQQAQYSMQSDGTLSREAEKNGMTLSEDNKKYLDEMVAAYREQAKTAGLSFQTLMSQYFGKGVTESVFRKVNTRSMLAYQWQEKKMEEFGASTGECETYYKDHPEEINKAVYYLYAVTWTNDEEATEEEIAAAKADAKAKAETLNSGATSFDSLYEGVQALAPDVAKSSLVRTSYLTNLSSQTDLYNFLKDEVRKSGDHILIENESSYDVVVFESVGREDYLAPSYRSITVTPSVVNDASSLQEARDRADAILKEWQEGEKTEESFAALAEQRAESGVVTNNGLTEDVVKTYTDSEEQTWLYSIARKTGNAVVVDTGSSYKVIYFVKWSDKPYWEIITDNKIINEKYTEYTDGLTEQNPYKAGALGQLFVTNKEKKTEPSPSPSASESVPE